MILSFEITFPNVGSWNGVFTGAKNLHFAFKIVTKQEGESLMQNNEYRNFYYNFGDGWGCNVKMTIISASDKRKIEKRNMGFMGYNWMIDSIIKHDKIISE